jgi:hypothetical protein
VIWPLLLIVLDAAIFTRLSYSKDTMVYPLKLRFTNGLTTSDSTLQNYDELHVTGDLMKHSTSPLSSKEKVKAHRERLRAQGLRPIQIWVPDTRTPEFAAEAHRQSLLVAESPDDKDDMAFIESLYEPAIWDED